jgi:hypothetical protein
LHFPFKLETTAQRHALKLNIPLFLKISDPQTERCQSKSFSSLFTVAKIFGPYSHWQSFSGTNENWQSFMLISYGYIV